VAGLIGAGMVKLLKTQANRPKARTGHARAVFSLGCRAIQTDDDQKIE
jgi:hypothetical protein